MGYCDKEFDKMVDQQSMEADPGKRKKLAWDADYELQQGDDSEPGRIRLQGPGRDPNPDFSYRVRLSGGDDVRDG
jgi:hypothetical protein